MTLQHADLGLEQAFVDKAYEMLDRGLSDAERSMGEFRPQHRSTALAIQRAMRILQESRGSGQLVFGKIRVDGEDRYIGRRRVRDTNHEPLVVSWHAPAAASFYEASPADPRGLELKRVFTEQDRRLVRILDEIVAAAASAATDTTGAGTAFSDALLLELERSRDGAMREVVATIQAEQHAIIRADLDRIVVVQGGPGTGKSVVGLHRAAWLAFNHERLRRLGVLVVAPSANFLTYVSGVLPSLDVTDVDQVELQRLYAGEAEQTGEEDWSTDEVKGSAEMAGLLARALEQRIGWDGGDLELSLGADRILIPGLEIAELIDDVRRRDLSHMAGRELIREGLARRAADLHRQEQNAVGRPARASEATIRRLSAFTNALDRMWPAFTAEELLRTLYATQSWLMEASDGVLTGDQRARLHRPAASSIGAEPWTEADLFCLDELDALLNRETVTYGHIVVDEAQDLSPMQARALARRCPSGSFTVLGDLAQATSAWVRDDWRELTAHLAESAAEIHTLSIGYRVPQEVLELAATQLRGVVPDFAPPLSIRTGAGAPHIVASPADGLLGELRTALEQAVADEQKTAILVADGDYDSWASHLESLPTPIGSGRTGDFSHQLTLLPQSAAKGLEFDTVVMLEPSHLARESRQPRRAMYVNLTRCTQRLVVLHTEPLPEGFGQPSPIKADVFEAPSTGAHRATPAEKANLIDLIATLDDDDTALVWSLVERLAGTTTKELDS